MTDIDRDYIVRGEAAVAYGLIDHIIDRGRSRIEPAPALMAQGHR